MHFFVNVKRLMVTTCKFVNVEGWLLTDRFVTDNWNFRQYLNVGKFLIGPKKHTWPYMWVPFGCWQHGSDGADVDICHVGPAWCWLVGPTKYYDKLDPQYSDRWDPQNSDKWDQVVADIWVPIMLTGGTHKILTSGPTICATWFHLMVTLWHFPSPFEFIKIWEHLNYLRNFGNKITGKI